MSEVTHILAAIASGDEKAAERLWLVVYDELRRLASRKLAQEKPGQTLDATALVHETYLRLVAGPAREQGEEPTWKSRCHFFAAAAEAMRRILVDKARRKKSRKRGGGIVRRDLPQSQLVAPQVREDLPALDEALSKLAQVDPQAEQLVKLRYFAGLTMPEAAKVLDLSARSAARLWVYARAWLHQALHEQ
jgi:RNA polymerase sigma factor (TIGR02999 family)